MSVWKCQVANNRCTSKCRSWSPCHRPQSCCGGPSAYSVTVVGNTDVAKEVFIDLVMSGRRTPDTEFTWNHALEDQKQKAMTRIVGNLLTIKFGHYADAAGTWRECIERAKDVRILFFFSMQQSVSMCLATCIRHKKIGIVKTTTGGKVSITKVGLLAETTTTWRDSGEVGEINCTISKKRHVAGQGPRWEDGSIVTITMSENNFIIKDGARVDMDITWQGYTETRVTNCGAWKSLNAGKWELTIETRGWKTRFIDKG